MKLILFDETFEKSRFRKISKCGKIFLIANLTCVGSFTFLLFDLLTKLLAVCILIGVLLRQDKGHQWCRQKYEDFMLYLFRLNSENLKAFEIQKKVAIPMFEDLPMLILQIIIKRYLDCHELKTKAENVMWMSFGMTVLNLIFFAVILNSESTQF